MINVNAFVKNPSGEKSLKVNGEGEISVTVHTHPPDEESRSSLPFRQFYTDNGSSDGSNDMRVNGSVTNVPFYISAQSDFDLYIKSASINLADAGAKLDRFGALAALTNGVEIKWNNIRFGDLVINEGIKSNIQFFRLTNQVPQIIDLSGGGADAIIVMIDFTTLFGTQYGVRLRKGSTDKIIFTVQDNLSVGLDQFDVIGYGIKV